MSLLSNHFAGPFFDALAQQARRVRRVRPASKELEDLHGVAIASSLARLVDFLGTHEPALRLGALGWFGGQGGYTIDWLPGRQNALAHALGQPFRTPAALGGALALGCDHGGNSWLVSLEAHRGANEVYWVDHDTDEPSVAATSVEAFALLMSIVERGDRVTPRERAALEGRVDSRLLSRVLPLRGLGASRIVARSNVGARLLGNADLVAVLTHRKSYDLAAVPAGKRTGASDVVADLLRLFLRGEDDALTELVRANARHRARLVRDAVRVLRPLLSATRKLPRGESVMVDRAYQLLAARPAARATVRSGIAHQKRRADVDAAVRGAAAEEAAGRPDRALKLLAHAIALEVVHSGAWLARCYALGELERWSEMKQAAAFTVRLLPASSYAYQQLAVALTGLGEHAASVVAGRRAVALSPDNAYARFNLALALAALGDIGARGMLKKALVLAPALRAAADDPDTRRAFALLSPR